MEEKENQPNQPQKWVIISEWDGKCNLCADARCELYKCNRSTLCECHQTITETYLALWCSLHAQYYSIGQVGLNAHTVYLQRYCRCGSDEYSLIPQEIVTFRHNTNFCKFSGFKILDFSRQSLVIKWLEIEELSPFYTPRNLTELYGRWSQSVHQ